MERSCFCCCCVVVLFMLLNPVEPTELPIVWDPYNPIFACNEGTINLKVNDQLKFICPDVELSRNPSPNSGVLYEKAYLLGEDQVEDFNNCNATDFKGELVHCDGKYSVTEHNVSPTKYNPQSLVFDAGKLYYVIGTSFRTQAQWNNLVGGSCSFVPSSSSDKAKQLKLKIRVCSESEIQSGVCVPCQSEACLYKGCGKTCTDWRHHSFYKKQVNQQDECFEKVARYCNNSILSTVNEEEFMDRSIDCQKNCSSWIANQHFQKEGQCLVLEKRNCNDSVETNKLEYRERTFDCQKNCSSWIVNQHFQNEGQCLVLEKRNCNDSVENNKLEYRERTLDCQKNCSSWIVNQHFQKEGQCLVLEKRNCNDSVETNKLEYRERTLDCQKNCSTWIVNQHFQKEGQCLVLEKRNCNDSVETNKLEYRERTLDCAFQCSDWSNVSSYQRNNSTSCVALQLRNCSGTVIQYRETSARSCPVLPKVVVVVEANKGNYNSDDNKEDIYKYILIPVAVIGLLIGFISGCLCHRHNNKKHQLKKNNVSPNNGFTNQTFKRESVHLSIRRSSSYATPAPDNINSS